MKVRLGLGWLVIAAMCMVVLAVATSGASASDGEMLVANVAGFAMAVTGSIGLLLLLSALFNRK